MSTQRRIMRLPEVIQKTGHGRSQIYVLIARGEFPKSRRIGARSVGWDSQEIQSWIDSKLGTSDEKGQSAKAMD